jgi:hypothetical protein
MVNLDKRSYRVEVIRPVWMPFNDVAYTIVESLVHKLGYPTTGPKAEKYAVMIASIIKAAQTLPKQSEGRKPKYVGVSFGCPTAHLQLAHLSLSFYSSMS